MLPESEVLLPEAVFEMEGRPLLGMTGVLTRSGPDILGTAEAEEGSDGVDGRTKLGVSVFFSLTVIFTVAFLALPSCDFMEIVADPVFFAVIGPELLTVATDLLLL